MKLHPLMSEYEVCKKCGEYHPRCRGHKKRRSSPDGMLHPCMLFPMHGFTGCKFHREGRTVGTANGRYKHGLRSKYLPRKIDLRLQSLQRTLNEPGYLSLKAQLELADARISFLVERLETHDSRRSWEEVRRIKDDLIRAVKHHDSEKLASAIATLGLAAEVGERDYLSWDELFKLQRHYVQLINAERRRLHDEEYFVSLDDCLLMFRAIGSAINDWVKDPSIRKELADRMRAFAHETGINIT